MDAKAVLAEAHSYHALPAGDGSYAVTQGHALTSVDVPLFSLHGNTNRDVEAADSTRVHGVSETDVLHHVDMVNRRVSEIKEDLSGQLREVTLQLSEVSLQLKQLAETVVPKHSGGQPVIR
eukprot:gnl/TRDRNA2_/TRDRNA2_32196_c0_seq2.p1 gnl/TRDRNA2_/TRDRNA2_32196_c0~~gnl/TRDRNA2_/TRDRNA2_32196_c0_seq2.p1  ORF type:complete len:121 (+),score=8.27 gnl/TRDRNA2_/TRDRNA2_32196_c0_seq2:86-448(+)